MSDNLLKRAKAFMGIDVEEDELPDGNASQLEISSILRSRKETPKERDGSGYDIILYEPKVYEDSLGISANLRAGSPVLVNLRHLEPSEGTRLIDFVCGTAYAIDGHMVKIADTIFLFAPSSIKVVDAEERSSETDSVPEFSQRRDAFFNQR
ncbi:MAG: cell division protein SepF [Candidatus Saganbacteria bacterium]|nr:cell division protein SepF [Candidatus Saganbacteria bacterium]